MRLCDRRREAFVSKKTVPGGSHQQAGCIAPLKSKPRVSGRKVGGGWRGWHIDFVPEFKPCDPCPDGYIARQEWAAVQMKAGMKQVECGMCSRWQFPQELVPDLIIESEAMTSRGEKVKMTSRVCLECEAVGRRWVEGRKTRDRKRKQYNDEAQVGDGRAARPQAR